jgi:hypothetical protein
MSPQSRGTSGGGRNNRPVVLGSIVVSIVAVGGLIAALVVKGAGSEDDAGNGGGATATSHAPGYRAGDASRTVETTECTEPSESNLDPDKVQMPNFAYKDRDSVVACMKAADWDYKLTPVDENTFGDGTVMSQSPKAGTDFDPENPPVMQLDVSTGNPG